MQEEFERYPLASSDDTEFSLSDDIFPKKGEIHCKVFKYSCCCCCFCTDVDASWRFGVRQSSSPSPANSPLDKTKRKRMTVA